VILDAKLSQSFNKPQADFPTQNKDIGIFLFILQKIGQIQQMQRKNSECKTNSKCKDSCNLKLNYEISPPIKVYQSLH